jgi:hypothetical protein
MAAKVVSVSAIAIVTNAITVVVMESFVFGVLYPLVKVPCVLSLNKYYYILMYTVQLNNTHT